MKKLVTVCIIFALIFASSVSAKGVADPDGDSLYISGAKRRLQKEMEFVSGTSSLTYFIPEMNYVQVLVNAEYDKDRFMDIYYPPDFSFESKLPVVVVFNGMSGMSAKNMGRLIDWCLLIAANGLISVTFDPVYLEKDYLNLLDYLTTNSDKLGIDNNNIGVLSYCGNCPDSMKAFKENDRPYFTGLKSGAFLYGQMVWSQDLKKDAEFLLVKTGKNTETAIKESMDVFIKKADSEGVVTKLIDYNTGYKYFDITENPHDPWEYGVDKRFTDDCNIIIDVINFFLDSMKITQNIS